MDPHRLIRERDICGGLRPEARSVFLRQVNDGLLPAPAVIGARMRFWPRYEIIQSLALDVAASRWPGPEFDSWMASYLAQQEREFGHPVGQWFHDRARWLRESGRTFRVITEDGPRKTAAQEGQPPGPD